MISGDQPHTLARVPFGAPARNMARGAPGANTARHRPSVEVGFNPVWRPWRAPVPHRHAVRDTFGAGGPAVIQDGKPAAVAERLAELASLHAQIARAYEGLAEEAGFALADLGGQSVHRVPMSPPPTARRDQALLRPREVAELLGFDPRTVRRLEVEGTLPAPVGKGRLKRWRRKDLEQWLADGGLSNRKRPGA